MSIEARVETTVTPVAQTTETIKLTVSGILTDLDNGLDRDKISVKYGLTKQEVNEVFKHPKLQGRRVKRKSAVRFVLEDDTVSTVNSQGQPKVLDYTEEETTVAVSYEEEQSVDPNLAMSLDARMVDGDPKHNQYFL